IWARATASSSSLSAKRSKANSLIVSSMPSRPLAHRRTRLRSTSASTRSRGASHDRLGRDEIETAGEDGKAGEEALLLGFEEVVAPLDRCPERALTFGGVAWPSRQER